MEGLRYDSVLRYRLCPGTHVDWTGARLELETEGGRLERAYRTEGEEVVVTTSLDLARHVIPPERVPEFRAFLLHALDQTSIWFRYQRADTAR